MTPTKNPSSPAAGVSPGPLARFVDYQKGAVVSREILSKPTGTVTVFAFDEGQGLSEHTAPFDALVHVIDGEAEITISGEPHAVAARRDHRDARQPAARAQGAPVFQNDAHHDPLLSPR